MYYLVTGNVPPQAADIPEEGIVFPTDMSSNIRETIAKSMSYLRKDRPHTIKEFLALLDSDEPIVTVITDESEKTKIAPQTPAPNRDDSRSSVGWWLWCLLLLFIVVLCISLKDLFRGGDNAKEVAKEEKRVEMPAEEVVTTHIESEPDVLGEQVEDEEGVTMDTPVEEPVPTGATAPVQAPGSDEAPPTAQQPVLTEVAVPVKVPETSAPYKVGDYYNENGRQGVVFEVSDGGRHGKIVSLDEAHLQWCNYKQYDKRIALGLTNDSDGKANTDKVMQRGDKDQYPAFVWCRDKGEDWYLPAKDELWAIFFSKSKINSTLAEYGAQRTNGWYWSSTEYEDDPEFCACHVNLTNGYTYDGNKCAYDSVRAVSAF